MILYFHESLYIWRIRLGKLVHRVTQYSMLCVIACYVLCIDPHTDRMSHRDARVSPGDRMPLLFIHLEEQTNSGKYINIKANPNKFSTATKISFIILWKKPASVDPKRIKMQAKTLVVESTQEQLHIFQNLLELSSILRIGYGIFLNRLL